MRQPVETSLKASILLVDDTPANLLTLGVVLEPLGQRLVEARSGEEALRHLLREDFAAILLDVAMPGMDGYETARLLRGRERSRLTPVLFITAYQPSPEGLVGAYSLGAVDFLVKPIVPVILRSKVSVFVELYLKTEQVKRQQEQLRQQQQEMLRSEHLAAVGQMGTSVAHEVRNPLTSIKLLVEGALRRESPRPLSQEQLTVIHREIARLERTVQEFLDFARPPKLHRRPGDLREMVAQSALLVRTRARQQGVSVHTCCPDRPIHAEVDHEQLGTVLVNLFLNALDALPSGGSLEASLEPLAEEVRLTVLDNGPGIEPEMVGQLFSPFVSSKPTGTGLGLFICKRIVEDHGGRISLVNRREGGTCVTILLPVSRPRLVMPKLLLVDDEEALCYSFRYVLGGNGLTRTVRKSDTAGTAAEGWELFQTEGADVLLDLQLPDRSGLELFRDIRQADPSARWAWGTVPLAQSRVMQET